MTATPTTLDLQSILSTLSACLPKSDKIDTLSARLADRPAQNTLMILGAASALFFAAERQENPKVHTLFDALEYCSSSLSVGYTSIFPQTPLGKLVASFLMTYGPALSGAMLEGPRTAPVTAAPDPTHQKILATLESILAQLRTTPSP